MKGYWQLPGETAKVLQGGWLKTGDVGYMNAKGYVTITDRKKDMILVSGFNVYPNEIESVVAMHPGVLECAVVGVPDERSGEAVKVVIVKKDPEPEQGIRDRALQAGAYRLQDSEVRRIPRQPAEDAHRQDPAARAARKIVRFKAD